MAHYAVDCWDAECLTSHGWIECVGCADRSAYDLKQHSNASGVSLIAMRQLSTPNEIVTTEIVPTKECVKRLSSRKAKQLGKYLAGLREQQKHTLLETINGEGYILYMYICTYIIRHIYKIIVLIKISYFIVDPVSSASTRRNQSLWINLRLPCMMYQR